MSLGAGGGSVGRVDVGVVVVVQRDDRVLLAEGPPPPVRELARIVEDLPIAVRQTEDERQHLGERLPRAPVVRRDRQITTE